MLMDILYIYISIYTHKINDVIFDTNNIKYVWTGKNRRVEFFM